MFWNGTTCPMFANPWFIAGNQCRRPPRRTAPLAAGGMPPPPTRPTRRIQSTNWILGSPWVRTIRIQSGRKSASGSMKVVGWWLPTTLCTTRTRRTRRTPARLINHWGYRHRHEGERRIARMPGAAVRRENELSVMSIGSSIEMPPGGGPNPRSRRPTNVSRSIRRMIQ